jgi:hypothetical protein
MTMNQYTLPVSMRGGWESLQDAKAHRAVVGKLQQALATFSAVADELKTKDRVDFDSTPPDSGIDLSKKAGQVIVLEHEHNGHRLDAEINFNPENGEVRSGRLDFEGGSLAKAGSTYRLQENDVTTFFYANPRGTFNVADPESEVPRLFGQANPQNLTKGTLQIQEPMFIFGL